jgi:hypothetical protein
MKDDKPSFGDSKFPPAEPAKAPPAQLAEPSESAKLAQEVADYCKNLTTQLPAEIIEKTQKLAEMVK